MGAKSTLDANKPTVTPKAQDSQWLPEEQAVENAAVRAEAAHHDEVLENLMPRRSSDAHREVPRTREDAINPRKDRSLADPSTPRRPLSQSMKREYNRTKVAVMSGMSKTRAGRVHRTLTDREHLRDLNQALAITNGQRSELTPNTQRHVDSVDRMISSYESTNERTHIVYTTLRAPHDAGSSRAAVRRRLAVMQKEDRPLEIDGYIPSTHDLGQVPEGRDVVLEIRTRSGAYVGRSTSLPNSDHLIGRGRRLRVVGTHEVEYTRPDGSTGTRLVAQVEDLALGETERKER